MPGDPVHENCGIAAVSLKTNTNSVNYLYNILLKQQNRGQLSAGISTYSPDRPQLLDTYKGMGLVNQVFRASEPKAYDAIQKKYSGSKGIGHVRYATFGSDSEDHAQPFERHHGRKWKWFSFGFNGNLANYRALKKELEDQSFHLTRKNDTEVMMHFFAREMRGHEKPDIALGFENICRDFDGAYNTVFLNALGEMAVLRDPFGFRPLNYAETDEGFFAASESVALASLGFENVKPLSPGMLVVSENGGVEIKKVSSPRVSRCMFEFVYFSDVCSEFDGRSVYEARWNLGIELAKAEPRLFSADCVVVPVPETSKVAAQAYAQETGLPYKEALIVNRYVGRTFIVSNSRGERVKEKFFPIKSILRGRNIVLVEDSVVRGTTMKNLVRFLRDDIGVKEVHLRVSCPPVAFPCFYGIDMSTYAELVASRHCGEERLLEDAFEAGKPEVESIRKELGLDSLVYQTQEGLVKALGVPKGELCMACLNGSYPTRAGRELKAEGMEHGKKCRRAYE